MSMKNAGTKELRVSLFDPTGNLTALVESPAAPEDRAELGARVMARFPKIEQVGFVRFPTEGRERAELYMAGGEFCANASMSAAALWRLRRGAPSPEEEESVSLTVSGVRGEVEVRLHQESAESFRASVRMPRALALTEESFSLGALRGALPVVRMEGIAHAIVRPDSPFFALAEDRAAAEEAVRAICGSIGAEALGLMFLAGEAPRLRLTPLVFVPGSGTLCWESSCASGSAAAGIFLSRAGGAPVRLELEEPGGTLLVENGGERSGTVLTGRTRFLGTEMI
jgi:diaminopimelate epimerase